MYSYVQMCIQMCICAFGVTGVHWYTYNIMWVGCLGHVIRANIHICIQYVIHFQSKVAKSLGLLCAWYA